MALTAPTGIDQSDLLLSALHATMIGDLAFFALGSLTGVNDPSLADLTAFSTDFEYDYVSIGELAEKPGKIGSKAERLKTRQYQVAGRRGTTIELTLNGLSAKQKDYLEGDSFSGEEITILLLPANYLAIIDDNTEALKAVVFNGMRWTVDWSGESDGLWTVVLSTELSGASADRVFVSDIPPEDEE